MEVKAVDREPFYLELRRIGFSNRTALEIVFDAAKRARKLDKSPKERATEVVARFFAHEHPVVGLRFSLMSMLPEAMEGWPLE